ncbi:alpha/beta-hydrolase [Xylariomycetidae sp. FL2044]|nr:alpha/beta-hydrolase [Xylariomycetidae sp. FL2044]
MAVASDIRPSTAHRRETFYVGGRYVPDDDKGTHTFQGQMYVERLVPAQASSSSSTSVKPVPIIFIHGATRSGTDWLTKPDGQPGWASYFLAQGFECYLVDLPFRGRSPWEPGSVPGSPPLVSYPAEPMSQMFTACSRHDRWPQSRLHTQWPGAGTADGGDPAFDALYASALPIVDDPARQESASQAACAALLDRVGRPAVLVGHSSGGPVPFLAADVRPRLVRAVIALEPAGPPFFKIGFKSGPGAPYGVSNAPITYEPAVSDPARDFVTREVQPPASAGPGLISCLLQAESPRQLVNLREVPVLLVTAQASYHAQYDWAMVAFLKQAGVRRVEHLRLQDKGILGNGHMMFMEMNSDEIAAELAAWVDGLL